MTNRYNFVVMEHRNPHYSYNFAALEGRGDAVFCNGIKEYIPFILKPLHRLHTSLKFNFFLASLKLDSLFLSHKEFWYPFYSRKFERQFDEARPLCFIVDADFFRLQAGFDNYINWLRRRYPNSRFVLFYQDLIEKYNGDSSIDNLRPLFDKVISFDKQDAQRYGTLYHPTVSSYIDPGDCSALPESDIYLLAHAKERLPLILAVYDHLTANGVNCRFLVLGVKRKSRIYRSGISYLNRPISYFENLQNVSRSRCVLEIMQKNAVGYTLRLWEAILYNKKFLTDNKGMVASDFYDPGYVSIFDNENLESIDLEFLKNAGIFDNRFKSRVTPDVLLEFVGASLDIPSDNPSVNPEGNSPLSPHAN